MIKKFILFSFISFFGCSQSGSVFYKSISGKSSVLGLTIPESSEQLKLEAFNSFNGQKVIIKDISYIKHEISSFEYIDFFGFFNSTNFFNQRIEVIPQTVNTNSFQKLRN